ncbi:MAG: hypothetical protein JSS32_04145 [Verrucomicrobia bacterium]|nr:hypothetical protein [Verrucomicrobiota bacterium]
MNDVTSISENLPIEIPETPKEQSSFTMGRSWLFPIDSKHAAWMFLPAAGIIFGVGIAKRKQLFKAGGAQTAEVSTGETEVEPNTSPSPKPTISSAPVTPVAIQNLKIPRASSSPQLSSIRAFPGCTNTLSPIVSAAASHPPSPPKSQSPSRISSSTTGSQTPSSTTSVSTAPTGTVPPLDLEPPLVSQPRPPSASFNASLTPLPTSTPSPIPSLVSAIFSVPAPVQLHLAATPVSASPLVPLQQNGHHHPTPVPAQTSSSPISTSPLALPQQNGHHRSTPVPAQIISSPISTSPLAPPQQNGHHRLTPMPALTISSPISTSPLAPPKQNGHHISPRPLHGHHHLTATPAQTTLSPMLTPSLPQPNQKGDHHSTGPSHRHHHPAPSALHANGAPKASPREHKMQHVPTSGSSSAVKQHSFDEIRCSDIERDNVREIVRTLYETNAMALAGHKSRLEGIGEKLNKVNTLAFLWAIFSDKDFSEKMHYIFSTFWWKAQKMGFMSGVNGKTGFQKHPFKDIEPYLDDWAARLGTTKKAVAPLIQAGYKKNDWEPLVKHLIEATTKKKV